MIPYRGLLTTPAPQNRVDPDLRDQALRPGHPSLRSGVAVLLTFAWAGMGATSAMARGLAASESETGTPTLASMWDAAERGDGGSATDLANRRGHLLRLTAPIGSSPSSSIAPLATSGSSPIPSAAIPYRTDFTPLARSFQDEPAEAAARPFRAKDGVYVAGLLLRAKIDDEDFDGLTAVAGGGSSEILPTADPGTGTGWAIGVRRRNASMEFNFTSADHEGMHVLRSGVVNSTSETYNFDFRRHFNVDHRFQPHVLFGIGIGCLNVEGGSVGLGRQEEASFTGLGLNLGVGAAYYATSSLSVAFDIGYRVQSYSSVDGVVDGSLADSVSGSGGFTGFRVSYTF